MDHPMGDQPRMNEVILLQRSWFFGFALGIHALPVFHCLEF